MHLKKLLSSGLCLVMAATLFPATAFAADTSNQPEYVLMNIPYADFYQAELNNNIPVDAFTSATLNKTRTASLVTGSYHVNSDGSDITGITYPVKIGEGVDLSSCKEVTDKDSVTISVTNRGQTSTTTYSGKDALFENESYAYYVLDEAPSYYKEATDTNNDGKLEFTSVQGKAAGPASVDSISLTTESSYGDYELSLTNPNFSTDTVYAVVLSTQEGNDYGLRHMENIWRGTELSWCTGFTNAVHNCPTSSDHYKAMMGQHINKITYYTEDGIFAITVDNLYVPVKFSGSVSVDDSASGTGSTSISFTDLPDDYVPSYAVEGLNFTIDGSTLSYTDAVRGEYTLTVSDQKGKYANLTSSFILSTSKMPAAYNSSTLSLNTASEFDAMDFAEYLTYITSVSVNGTAYAASGRGAVTIINDDGSIDLNAKSGETSIFGSDGSYAISVSATGYPELTFTLLKTSKPAESTTQKPAETTTQKPAETTTQKPAETTTQKPAETTTQKPAETTTQRPAETTTQKPSATQQAKVITKTYGQKAFSVKKSGTTTYTSSNKNIISVSKTGTATIKGVGKVVLTIRNKKNGKTTTTKTTYLVKPGTIASKSLKAVNLASKKIKVSWTKRAGLGLTASKVRYQIQYSTSKKFTKSTTKTITVKGNTTTRTITKLKKNKTYYIRMRGYDQTNKKAGAWSSVKKVTVKK